MFSLLILVLPVILAMDAIVRDLVTPSKQLGEACGYESCSPTQEGALNVHIVPHTHGELGFTGDFHTHYTGDLGADQRKTHVNMKRILDYTITELWADSERKFTLSDMAYFFHWWKQRDGTVHRMVYELVRQGRLHFVGGGYSMCDEATTSYHAVIDMFTYSLEKLNSTFLHCARPLVSWQSDVFGHSREFASLLPQMGFGGHFINPISYDDEVVRMLAKTLEFVWRGSDDLGASSDIYTHKLFDGYWSPPGFCFGTFCDDPLLVSSDTMFKNVEDRVQAFIDSAKNRQAPYYSTKNIMVVMGQRFGYFDAGVWFANIDKLIHNANGRPSDSGYPVNVFYSTPACYFRAVLEAKPELSIKQDDFIPFSYDQSSVAVGFYTARPTLKYLVRQGHVFLQIAKQLQVTAGLLKGYDALMEKFKWINSVIQDHNVITGVMPEHSWQYYTHKMYAAIQESTKLVRKAFNNLRNSPAHTVYFRCSFNISICQRTDAQQYFIVVYNPLAWDVNVKVRLPTLKQEFVVYHPSGKEVKASIIRISDPVSKIHRHNSRVVHELVFVAEDVPAMGFRSYFIRLKTIGWTREKRSILKKIKKLKTKKYLVKQVNPIAKDAPEDNNVSFDYEYFEGTGVTTPKTKIMFGSVEKTFEKSDDDVITPRGSHGLERYRPVYDIPYEDNASSEVKLDKINEFIDFGDFKFEQDPFKYEDPMVTHDLANMTFNNDDVMAINKLSRVRNGTEISNNILGDNNTDAMVEDGVLSKTRKSQGEETEIHETTTDLNEITETYRETVNLRDGIKDITVNRADKEWNGEKSFKNDHDILEKMNDLIKLDAKSKSATFEITNKTDIAKSKLDDLDLTDPQDSDFSDINLDINNVNNSRKTSFMFGNDDQIGNFDQSLKEQLKINLEEPKNETFRTDDENWFIQDKVDEEIKEESKMSVGEEIKDKLVDEQKPKVGRVDEKQPDPEGYYYYVTDDYFIENQYIRIQIDNKRQLSNITLSNGVNISFNAEIYFYASDDPKKFNRDDRPPGITMFRAMDPRPQLIKDYFKVTVYKNKIVQEIQYEFSNYASFVIRLYDRDPVIELDWLVGPVPIRDDIGKEIFVRYTTNLIHGGIFYTDSNGRQTIKRIRNRRATYETLNPNYLAGNIYPVTSKIYIEDETKNIRFSVLNDRAQGGTSLADGEIDIFLHRRILTDDTNRGILTLNETEYGEGIRVRGKHYLYLTKADYKPNRIFEKKLAKEIELAPQIFVTRPEPYGKNSKHIWMEELNEFSALKTKLPVGIHLLTLEKWGQNRLLIRIENYLEKSDTVKNGIKKVYLKGAFRNINIITLRETNLAANMWIQDSNRNNFRWKTQSRFYKNFNSAYGDSEAKDFVKNDFVESVDITNWEVNGIVMKPQQIRTFFATYDYV